MCEFCTSHGEGAKWYDNARNYSSEVFRQVNSDAHLRAYLMGFERSLAFWPRAALGLKRLMPSWYARFVYPRASRAQMREHFGQVVPLEDAERIVRRFASIVRLPCVCRKVTVGKQSRVCLGIGLDLTHLYGDIPFFGGFDRIGPDEAVAMLRALDAEGCVHSIWTFRTPYIGAMCNCDRDCMGYRAEVRMGVTRTMWRAEYVASIDRLRCTGCMRCRGRCLYGALEPRRGGCEVSDLRCYGCGICRAACEAGAISLLRREDVPGAANVW